MKQIIFTEDVEIKEATYQLEKRGIHCFFGDSVFCWSGVNGVPYFREEESKVKWKTIKIGMGTKIYPPVIIYHGCEIGKNSTICSNVFLRENTKIGDNTVIGTGTVIEGDAIIKNNTTIHSQCHITKKCEIGNNVFAAPFLLITNTKKIVHNRDYDLVTYPTIIKDNARLGGNITLNPSIIIGENALIGSGSLVTKNIPKEKIAFGNPAKIKGDVPLDEILKRDD